MSKLDRLLVSDSFLPLWSDLKVIALDRKISDHCPIMLEDSCIDFGPKPFKVFDEWFLIEGIDEVISQFWNKDMPRNRKDCVFRNKLKRLKLSLKDWSKSQFGGLDEGIENVKKIALELEIKAEAGLLSIGDHDNWLNSRKTWIEKERTKCISADQAATLEDVFTENEIWEALSSCGSSKASGPDGFNLGFFKKMMEDPLWFGDYRLISLIGSYYKIIAKLLSNRFRKVIRYLIGAEQSAFMSGRYILDGILVVNETVDYLKKM
ncbi:uncharacterized protein [Rutidosis leptorrhynchoides]|uniref:uncharacterized protein n=1 Tax=Rutidosis leptorrhynchoides TaxID=125765 RepID=UPI003A99AEB0